MEALVWHGGVTVSTARVAAPVPLPGWVLVEPAFTGLCGTDLHICAGHHPRARPGLVLGHEVAGRVVAGTQALPEGTPVFVNPLLACHNCRPCRQGRPNVCDDLGFLGIDRAGGAAGLVAVPEGALVELPTGLTLERAALAEPLAVAVHAVELSGLRAGQAVRILGAGPIGLLVALYSRHQGAEVRVSEPSPHRAKVGRQLGFEVDPPARDLGVSDIVFDCTGSVSVAGDVLGHAVTGGVVVTVAVYPGVVGIDLQDLAFRELTVLGTRAYQDQDVTAALSMLAGGEVATGTVISDIMPLHEGAAALERLRRGEAVKILLAGPST